jgi:choline-sulfatase
MRHAPCGRARPASPRRLVASRGSRRGLLALAVAALALASSGCERKPAAADRPPVVLVSIDTLRADRLPAYGHRGGAETPALDALRRDGILVERAYTHVPLTLPAHASLFTGLLPPQHGVRDNSGYRLDGAAPTLASLLRGAGYATGAAVSAYVLRAETGVATGFDFFDDALELGSGAGLADQQRSGLDSLAASLPWLRRAARDGPFLYWLHVYEPHTPYAPPEPYRSRYPSGYDGEIAAADAVVGRLIEELRQLEVYERSLIVIVSDHGEGLGDHGEAEHGILLYREALQVPLLLKLPGNQRAGEVIERPAQLIDLLPTVLELVGVDVAGAAVAGAASAGAAPVAARGRSLLGAAPSRAARPAPGGAGRAGAAAREPPIYAESWYPRLHHGWSELRSAISGDLHFIDGPDPELYDLAADPAERRNLVASEPRAAAALESALAELDVEPGAPADEDAETRRRLAALGYLSAPARATSGEGRARPDPKTQLSALRALDGARQRFTDGDLPNAQRELELLVRQQPAMVDAWETLGDLLESDGRFEQALAARRRAVEASGAAPEQALKIAPLLLQLGHAEEAKQHARLAVDAFPSTAHTVLARVALESGDLDEAEREARAAAAARAGTVTPVLTLAEVLAAKGDGDGALAVIAGIEAELLERAVPDPRPFLLRAEILTRQRREAGGGRESEPGNDLAGGREGSAASAGVERAIDEAEREAKRLVALHPESAVGRAALARVGELRSGAGAPSVREAAPGSEPSPTPSFAALERAWQDGKLDDARKPMLALEWSRRGRTREAAALVEPLARRGDPEATRVLAVALTDGGDHHGARRVLEPWLALHPDDAAALETLGLVELRVGEASAAAGRLERSVALAPGAANAWNLLGVARWQGSRDAAGAIAAWESALALDPARWEALQNLASVALETGRLEQARDALTRFVEQAPADRYAEELAAARRTLAGLAGGKR